MEGALVYLEEQSILTAKVLEDGTFGNTELECDVPDPGGMITVLGKVLRGGFNDAAALRFGAWARWRLALVERRSSAITGDSRHSDSKSQQHTAGGRPFQLHFMSSLR